MTARGRVVTGEWRSHVVVACRPVDGWEIIQQMHSACLLLLCSPSDSSA